VEERMNRSIEVRVPGHPPGGNELHRMGKWGIRKSREEWRQATFVLALDARPGDWRPMAPVSLGVTWRYRIRRNRDLDNLVAGLKPVIDGLVDAGILEDDHSGILVSLGPFLVETGADRDETVLVLTEG
jgi:Holliday junction resolvase RusA-like endonuclease